MKLERVPTRIEGKKPWLPAFVGRWAVTKINDIERVANERGSPIPPPYRRLLKDSMADLAARLYVAASRPIFEKDANVMGLRGRRVQQMSAQKLALRGALRSAIGPEYDRIAKELEKEDKKYSREKAEQNFHRLADDSYFGFKHPLSDIPTLVDAITEDSRLSVGLINQYPEHFFEKVLVQHKRLAVEKAYLAGLTPENSAELPPTFLKGKYGEYTLFHLEKAKDLAVETQLQDHCIQNYLEEVVPDEKTGKPKMYYFSIGTILDEPKPIAEARVAPVDWAGDTQDSFASADFDDYPTRRSSQISIAYNPRTGDIEQIKGFQNNEVPKRNHDFRLYDALFAVLSDMRKEFPRLFGHELKVTGGDLDHLAPKNKCLAFDGSALTLKQVIERREPIIGSSMISAAERWKEDYLKQALSIPNLNLHIGSYMLGKNARDVTPKIHEIACNIVSDEESNLALPALEVAHGKLEYHGYGLDLPKLKRANGWLSFADAEFASELSEGLICRGGDFRKARNLSRTPIHARFGGPVFCSDMPDLVEIGGGAVFSGPAYFSTCSKLRAIRENVRFLDHTEFIRSSLSVIEKNCVFSGKANFGSCVNLVSIDESVVFESEVDLRGCRALALIPERVLQNSKGPFLVDMRLLRAINEAFGEKYLREGKLIVPSSGISGADIG